MCLVLQTPTVPRKIGIGATNRNLSMTSVRPGDAGFGERSKNAVGWNYTMGEGDSMRLDNWSLYTSVDGYQA